MENMIVFSKSNFTGQTITVHRDCKENKSGQVREYKNLTPATLQRFNKLLRNVDNADNVSITVMVNIVLIVVVFFK